MAGACKAAGGAAGRGTERGIRRGRLLADLPLSAILRGIIKILNESTESCIGKNNNSKATDG